VSRGSALLEFALAWPLLVLVVLAAVQLSVWGAEAYAARSAALAGARVGSTASGGASAAAAVAVSALQPSLVGTRVAAWCPGGAEPAPEVWVCARDLGGEVQVEVGGSVPGLLPVPGGRLPLRARVGLAREAFSP